MAIEETNDRTPKPVYEIGLVLAGAVSAGAYTAGVIDFLLEALEAWSDAKANKEKVPQHEVKIRVITGASAGGMTAAMAAATIYRKSWQQPMENKSIAYQSWVEEIDITKLLDTRDIDSFRKFRAENEKRRKSEASKKSKPGEEPANTGSFYSFLDSSVIEDIADEALNVNFDKKEWRQLPYVCDSLKLYVTLSNLRGLPYSFSLRGETNNPFAMYNHMDYHYMEISRREEKLNEENDAWENLKSAAIATGAFPIGLSARIIKRKRDYYEKRLNADGSDLSPFLRLKGDDSEYNFVAVDGGMLNNEPIELAEAALFAHRDDVKDKTRELSDEILEMIVDPKMAVADPKEAAKASSSLTNKAIHEKKVELAKLASSAVIMVDPFPTFITESAQPINSDRALMKILGPIVNALMSQALFRPKELLRAASDDIVNRFLIAPVRRFVADENSRLTADDKVAAQKKADQYPIACGFLGGFGGFLSESFRQHDYELGRRNCQRFLEKYFTLDYAVAKEIPAFEKQVKEDLLQQQQTPELIPTKFQIIPLVGRAKIEQGRNNPWPTYSQTDKKRLLALLEERLDGIATSILPWYLRILYNPWTVFLVPVALFFIYFFAGDGLTGPEPVYVSLLAFLSFVLASLIVGKIILHKRLVAWIWSKLESEMNDYGLMDKTESKV